MNLRCMDCGHVFEGKRGLDAIPDGERLPLRFLDQAFYMPVLRVRCGTCYVERERFVTREERWNALDMPREEASNRGPNAVLMWLDVFDQQLSRVIANREGIDKADMLWADRFNLPYPVCSGPLEERVRDLQGLSELKRRKMMALRFMIATGIAGEKQHNWGTADEHDIARFRTVASKRDTFQKQAARERFKVKSVRPASVALPKVAYQQRGHRNNGL